MKKNWLTIAEIGIAIVGLLAWFMAGNIYVAAGAALLMFVFAVTKPIIDARKAGRSERYVERQFDRAESQLDEQLVSLTADLPRPDLTHRAVIATIVDRHLGDHAAQQLKIYDQIVDGLNEGATQDEIDPLIHQMRIPFVAQHLHGLIDIRGADYAEAAKRFHINVQQKSDWAEAWFCWLLCEFVQGRHDVVIKNNPHINGVELLPYAPSDQDGFIALTESDRDQVVSRFQASMKGIGDLFAASSLQQSRNQFAQTHAEYRRAA